jgi:hypothetical protein
MKKRILKTGLLLTLTASLFTACINDDSYEVPNINCTETSLVKTKEVSEIPASPIVAQYVADEVIEAYVTSSDLAGNFYKSISFQTLDGSKGFSVPVDVTSTFTNFEPGRKVLIKMKDLYTDSPTTGPIGMRIGGLYVNSTGIASVGRLTENDYKKVLNRSCTVISEDVLVKPVTITQAKTDAMLNILVELDGVQFSDDAITTTYYDSSLDLGGATNHLLTDANGNSIIFRTSSFANFAHNNVPSGRGKIRGVMTKYGTDYQFVARSESDIRLTGERLQTLFNESFTTNFPLWTAFSVTGPQVWTQSATFGNPGACAKMSGFSGSSIANEDWLITPNIDLTTATTAVLTFDTASRFSGNQLQMYVSTNYSGTGSPALATWTEITGVTLDLNIAAYVWTASGPVDLTSYLGNNVRVGFKYTSTSTASSTWELDNVKVVGN